MKLATVAFLSLCIGLIAGWSMFSPNDCGIHIGSGVTGATISGAKIEGHKFGVCVDSARSLTLTDNTIRPL